MLPGGSLSLRGSADWTRVYLTMRENSRDRGFSFILDEPFTEPRAIIGWNQGADRPFLLCTLWSCTPLEGGSYRVRLCVDEVIPLKTGKRRDDAECSIAEPERRPLMRRGQ